VLGHRLDRHRHLEQAMKSLSVVAVIVAAALGAVVVTAQQTATPRVQPLLGYGTNPTPPPGGSSSGQQRRRLLRRLGPSGDPSERSARGTGRP
jgi:hypothetical protein